MPFLIVKIANRRTLQYYTKWMRLKSKKVIYSHNTEINYQFSPEQIRLTANVGIYEKKLL